MKIFYKYFVFIIALIIFANCSKNEKPEPDPKPQESVVTNIVMPSQEVIYKPGQRLTINGTGFDNTSAIYFVSSNIKEKALNISYSKGGITFDTPVVYGRQTVLLNHQGKDVSIGELVFEAQEIPIDQRNKVSQFADFSWDGNKRANVYYQIFVRSFADSNGDGIGDINGITAKLDYLNQMGIAGIWLTPINPSDSYHGYDVIDYKAINSSYGTIEDFENLINKAHGLGIKVVLDYVINHTSIKHPWFTEACKDESNIYRDFYIFSKDPQKDIAAGLVPMISKTEQGGYDAGQWFSVASGTTAYKFHSHFWTSSFADLNYGADASKAYLSGAFKEITDGAKYWIDKGVDGFRLDAVKHIYHNESSSENPTMLKQFYDAVNSYYKQINPSKGDIYMVGEVLSEYNVAAPYYNGLPALFDFSSWWRMEYAIQNSHAKWYPKDIIQYLNAYSSVNSNYINATKLSNHDEVRTRTTLGGSASVSLERAKMAAAILFTSTGSPYVYYGEEIGMFGDKKYGDEGVREPMLWSYSGTDMYRTSWQQPRYSTDATIDNVQKQEGVYNSIYNTYKFLISLRNNYPTLAMGSISLPDGFNDTDSNDKNFMVFYREYQGVKFLVIHNVSDKKNTYSLKRSIKKTIGDINYPVLLKMNDSYYSITMPAYSTIIFEI